MLQALKMKAAMAAALLAAGPMTVLATEQGSPHAAIEAPALVEIAAGTLHYRAPGEFIQDGKPVNAPRVVVTLRRPVAIMKNQVSVADYQRCVDEHGCAARTGAPDKPDLPAVMVSWRDAQAYASWLSHRLGKRYRLPSDEEWTFAAGDRAANEAPITLDSSDPAKSWLARYEREANLDPVDKEAKPIGSFGANEHGLLDVSGNVWEWTASCFTRTVLDQFGAPTGVRTENCGVRVVEGRHRTYIPDFIRDPRAGGCAVGTPPSNLGFRLVLDRDRSWWLF